MIQKRIGVALGIGLVTVAAGGASASLQSRNAQTPMRQTPTRVSPAKAVRAALAATRHQSVFAPFPRRPGRVSCGIPSGGVGHPRPIPGWCETAVTPTQHRIVVTFSETWKTETLRTGNVDPTIPFETHTWFAVETRRYRVTDGGSYGDLPPQWVR